MAQNIDSIKEGAVSILFLLALQATEPVQPPFTDYLAKSRAWSQCVLAKTRTYSASSEPVTAVVHAAMGECRDQELAMQDAHKLTYPYADRSDAHLPADLALQRLQTFDQMVAYAFRLRTKGAYLQDE